jgi:hypothetical protein
MNAPVIPEAPSTIFREPAAERFQLGLGLVDLVIVCVFVATRLWIGAAILGAFAAFRLVSARGRRVAVSGDWLVLHSFGQVRRIPISDIAHVDPNYKGWYMRCPSVILRSGETVPLRPFRCPSMLVTRSRATERLAEHMAVPATDVGRQPPVFRGGWLLRASVVVVGFFLGGILLLAGAVMIVQGNKHHLDAVGCVVVGGVLCVCGAWATRAQRASARVPK